MGSLKKSTFRAAAERGGIDTKTVAWLGCVAVALIVTLYATVSLGRHETWTPDGLLYAQQMLEDAGEPARSAQLGRGVSTPHSRSATIHAIATS